MSQLNKQLITATIAVLLACACATVSPAPTSVPPTGTALALVPTPTPAPPTSTPLPPTNVPTSPAPTSEPPSATPTAEPEEPAVSEILAGLQGLPLEQFFDESYRQLLMRNPEGLTYAGVSQLFGLRNDRLNNLSEAFVRDTQALEDGILDLLQGYHRSSLTPEQQVSFDVYEWYLDGRARGHGLADCEYPVHFMVGSYDVELERLFTEIQPLESRQDVEDYVSRLSGVDDQVAQLMEGLKRREKAGAIPPRFIIEMTIPNLQAIARAKAASTPFYTSFFSRLAKVQGISEADQRAFRAAALDAIETSVIPAYRGLAGYFEGLAQVATDDAGLWRLPNGEACYAYLLRRETSTDLTAEEIHALGLAEVARIQEELRQAFTELGYPASASLGELMQRAIEDAGFLNTQTQAGKDQAVTAYESLLAGMRERIGEVIDLRPETQVVVVGDPESGGFFVPGSRDGSRPGAFHAYVGGEWLARYSMATVAYHETIPGHGFQTAVSTELDLPLFRTDLFFSGYAEGWALYSERLAWELGMYEDNPYGNIGRLQLELLRAVRLVTDTGLHAQRWTRAQAKAYMNEALGDPSGRMSGEVERYVVLPAQATGYKIGMLKILELRQRAMDELGPRFDLVEFHRAVLGSGMVPLEILEQIVDRYIAVELGR